MTPGEEALATVIDHFKCLPLGDRSTLHSKFCIRKEQDMAYNFKASGLKVTGFDGIEIQSFFEGELFDEAQAVIEKLAVATGNSPALDPGKIEGVFAILIARDENGNRLVGLQPLNPINADIINAGG